MAELLYLVGMRTGPRLGCSLLVFVLATLSGVCGATAQTPSPGPGAAEAQAANSPPVTTADEAPTSGLGQEPLPTQPALATAPAAPEAPQAPPPQPPTIDLRKDPPLPPPIARTDRLHDGFYARLSLGFGQLGTTMNAPNSGAVDGEGSTLALDVALGYAPNPGIVLGGALLMESLPSATMDLGRSGMTGTSDVGVAMVGPLFDGYPTAHGGFHLGGALGFARTTVQRPEEAAGFKNAGGFGIAGWLGYDVWVADQWSAGVLLRLMGTRTKGDAEATANNDPGSATMATQSIALMLTGVYN